jgi:hypothetical protein
VYNTKNIYVPYIYNKLNRTKIYKYNQLQYTTFQTILMQIYLQFIEKSERLSKYCIMGKWNWRNLTTRHPQQVSLHFKANEQTHSAFKLLFALRAYSFSFLKCIQTKSCIVAYFILCIITYMFSNHRNID